MIFLIITYLSLIVKSLAVSNIIYSSQALPLILVFSGIGVYFIKSSIVLNFSVIEKWQRRNIKMVFALSQNEIL